jgi:hypothetical protein
MLCIVGAQGDARVQGWRSDLAMARDDFLARDLSFSDAERRAASADFDRLAAAAGRMDDATLALGIARAVARSGNAHTRAYLLRNRTWLRRYPIRVWSFADGPHIVSARGEHAQLLEGKITRIGGRPVEAVTKRVRDIFAGTPAWQQYMASYSLTCPDVLEELALTDAGGRVVLTVEHPDGRVSRPTIGPSPLARSDTPVEAWWDLAPDRRQDASWAHALDDAGELPIYLVGTATHYRLQFLPDGRAMYVQVNRSLAQEPESPTEFARRLLRELEQRGAERLVIDLRFNTGGNLLTMQPLLDAIASTPLARQHGGLVVLVGRATFSAGMHFAAWLEENTQAELAGEPVGDELDYWAEGGNLVLPWSRITLHYADRYHSYSKRQSFVPEHLIAFDLGIGDLEPDVPVATTARDYFSGRDPVLDAAIAVKRPKPPVKRKAHPWRSG